MKWDKIKRKGKHKVNGYDIDLSHLQDITYTFTIEKSKKQHEITFEVLVQYSSHCVSWGAEHGKEIDFTGLDTACKIIDEKGIKRCFCDDRYELSKKLPDIFQHVLNYKCFFTGRENLLFIEFVTELGEREEYEIYFNVTKQGKNKLRLFVESAYIRDEERLKTKPLHFSRRDKVSVKILFAKKLRNLPIIEPLSKK